MPWHRSSLICPQVKDPQASIARPFTKRLLTERRPSGAGVADLGRGSAAPAPRPAGLAIDFGKERALRLLSSR